MFRRLMTAATLLLALALPAAARTKKPDPQNTIV